MIHPISFSIPAEKIVKSIPQKTKILATCIPNDPATYVFANEQAYYEDYQKSLFAITQKKAGFDCCRHYEILANGCIPLFEDIQSCPANTMTHFPKHAMLDAINLYNKIKTMTQFHETHHHEYTKQIAQLLDHTRKYLTTVAMAKYLLQCIPLPSPQRILYLSGDSPNALMPDYMKDLLLHGFKQSFGKKCHDWPCIAHLYTDFGSTDHLYGRGFTYSKLLDRNEYRDDKLDENVLDDIMNKRYDLIVYGSAHRGLPYVDTVLKIYGKDQVVFICGEDLHECRLGMNIVKEGGMVFRREE